MKQIDDTAAPGSLTDDLIAIPAGKSALFDHSSSLTSIRSTLTRIKRRFPGRRFTTRETPEGIRVWRLSEI